MVRRPLLTTDFNTGLDNKAATLSMLVPRATVTPSHANEKSLDSGDTIAERIAVSTNERTDRCDTISL